MTCQWTLNETATDVERHSDGIERNGDRVECNGIVVKWNETFIE
jgi:hypothetical protein